MKINWKCVAIAGIASQLLLLLMMRFLVALHDGQIFWLINILAHFIPLFLGGVWIARKIQSRFLLHGVLVGIIANLLIIVILPILMLLDVRGPADVTSSQATRGLLLAVKMIGSATGAYVGGRLKHKNLQQIPLE